MAEYLGVAGACCAYLLRDFRVRLSHGMRPRVPAILVSQMTQALICDVFRQPELFHGLPRIDRRIVAWGALAETVALPHSAVLISEEALTARLRPAVLPAVEDAEWTVFASRPLPESTVEHHFGSRRASAVPVDLKTPEASACWVESLENGWLFLIPGWLIAVGGAPDTLLAQSHLVAGQVAGIGSSAAEFPAYPRIAEPLCAPGWLACGSAAMAFDPICGDGTGNAVREAVLASAVIRAANRGEDVESLLAHYRARLIAGFQRHLQLALEFYRAGNCGPWWDKEIHGIERGIAWCAGELAAAPPFRFRLSGFELVRLS